MITMDDLSALTKSAGSDVDKKQVTLVLDEHATAATAVRSLTSYFGRRRKQQAVRLVLGDVELGYLRRTDLYHLVSSGTRGIDDSAGATLPGRLSGITLIELCCPTVGCPRVLVVTRYDKNDPPTCGEHGTAMELCK